MPSQKIVKRLKIDSDNSYTREGLRWLILMLIIRSGTPIEDVTCEKFRDIVHCLHKDAVIPDTETLEKDIDDLFDTAKRRLRRMTAVWTNSS